MRTVTTMRAALIYTLAWIVVFGSIESKPYWKIRFADREKKQLIDKCSDETDLNSNNMNLTRISLSASDPDEIKYISARHNLLTGITSNEIRKFKKLVCLDLAYNSIPPQRLLFGGIHRHLKRMILHDQRLFKDCVKNDTDRCTTLGHLGTYVPSLAYLNIARSHIKHISPFFYFMFPNLKWIDASGNRIDNIQDFFQHLQPTLTHIFMSNMGIRKLEISKLIGVRVLILDRNTFSSLGHKRTESYLILRDLENLKYLSLRYCMIETINDSTFGDTRNLTDLDLSHNFIRTLSGRDIGVPTLQRLFLNDNYLSKFPTKMGMTKLKVLSLSENEFSQFPNSFKGFESLETLLFKRNKIQIIKKEGISSLSKLKLLDVGNNKLKRLPIGWMDQMTQLQYLNVDHNKFDSLKDIAINKSSNLRLLLLSGKYLFKIHLREFIQHFPFGLVVIHRRKKHDKIIVRVSNVSEIISVYNHQVII